MMRKLLRTLRLVGERCPVHGTKMLCAKQRNQFLYSYWCVRCGAFRPMRDVVDARRVAMRFGIAATGGAIAAICAILLWVARAPSLTWFMVLCGCAVATYILAR